MKRNAYVLAVDRNSREVYQTKSVLSHVGFNVILVDIIPHKDVAISNKLGMLSIYKTILETDEDWCYIFEDDINIVDDISIDEIIQYESISEHMFYLGCCTHPSTQYVETANKIGNHDVYSVSNVRCLTGLGVRRTSVPLLLNTIESNNQVKFLDELIGRVFTCNHPSNVVRRYTKAPDEPGHIGAFYQDRKTFPSRWHPTNWKRDDN